MRSFPLIIYSDQQRAVDHLAGGLSVIGMTGFVQNCIVASNKNAPNVVASWNFGTAHGTFGLVLAYLILIQATNPLDSHDKLLISSAYGILIFGVGVNHYLLGERAVALSNLVPPIIFLAFRYGAQ